jgi:large subunit ribosomal protein L6
MLILNMNTNLSFTYLITPSTRILFRKTATDSVLIIVHENQELFFKIPKTVSFVIEKDKHIVFFIKAKENIRDLLSFKSLLINTNLSKNLFKKKLELNGLGFKFLNINESVDLKLGYSHLISLSRPKTITKIGIRKKRVTLESNDKIKLGNFANLLYKLRKYDSYKGKGFSFLNIKKKLKEIKKK